MSPVISGFRARPILAPLARPITTAKVAIEKAPLVLIDIETKAGIVGRNYIFGYNPYALSAICAFANEWGSSLVGKSVSPLDRAAEAAEQFHLIGRSGLVGMVLSGIDLALWDAHAQALERPVCSLFGAEPVALDCYDSQGVFLPGRDEALVEDTLARGFKAVKFKLGFETVQEDVEALQIIRQMIGPEMPLMLDFNQTLSAPEATRRIKTFEDAGLNLTWIEEPVPAEDFAGYQSIRANVDTPLQSGENWWNPADAARAIGAGTTDFAMPDLMRIGGLSGWFRAAAMAEAASIPTSSHLFIEASAHALAATPNRHYLEYMDICGALLDEPYTLEDGTLTARGPGLGLKWNETAIARNSP